VRSLGQNNHRSTRHEPDAAFFCPQAGRLETSCRELRSDVVPRQEPGVHIALFRKDTKTGYWQPIRRMASSTWAVTIQRGRFPLVPSRYFPYRRISAKFLKSRMCVSEILSLPLSSETAPP
jgi:hypothetical protein